MTPNNPFNIFNISSTFFNIFNISNVAHPRITTGKLHQNPLNSIDGDAFRAYFNIDPKWPLDYLWPQIP